MTNSSRKFLFPMLLVALPIAALAQIQPAKPAATPPPRPQAVISTPSHTEQWQRQVDRQQVQNAQNQNAVRQQLQQNNSTIQRNNTTDPAMRNQIDSAQRSQDQLDRARQDATQRQYQNDSLNRPGTTPARAGSLGR
jgi:TolA-binding protein